VEKESPNEKPKEEGGNLYGILEVQNAK